MNNCATLACVFGAMVGSVLGGEPVHLIVGRGMSHLTSFSHTHITSGRNSVIFTDKTSPNIAKDENGDFQFVLSLPDQPMSLTWIGTENDLPKSAMAVQALSDGRLLVATVMKFDDVERTGIEGVGNPRFERLEIEIFAPDCRRLARLADLTYWPQVLDAEHYFDEGRHQVRRFDGAGEPVQVPRWIDDLRPINGRSDRYVFSVTPFDGIQDAEGVLLTGATWHALIDLGNGFLAGYRADRQVEILNADGHVVVPARPGVPFSLGDGTYVIAERNRSTRVGAGGVEIETYDFRTSFRPIRSKPGWFVVGVFDEQGDTSEYRLWHAQVGWLNDGLAFERVFVADDASPYLAFQDRDDAGLLDHSGNVVYRLAASDTSRWSLKEGEERWEWRAYGRVYRNATMFRLEVDSFTMEGGVQAWNQTTHEYLFDSNGEVLWSSEGAPSPNVIRTAEKLP